MGTTLNAAAVSYLKAKTLSRGTRNEYHSTLRKRDLWGHGVTIEVLRRKDVREFLDWVYERAVAEKGVEPGTDGEQGPRAASGRPFLGLGAGTPRIPAPLL